MVITMAAQLKSLEKQQMESEDKRLEMTIAYEARFSDMTSDHDAKISNIVSDYDARLKVFASRLSGLEALVPGLKTLNFADAPDFGFYPTKDADDAKQQQRAYYNKVVEYLQTKGITTNLWQSIKVIPNQR